jgi:stage V sporulation protein B
MFRVSMSAALVTGLFGTAFLFFGAGWLARSSGYPEAVYAIRTLSPTVFICAVMAVYRGYFQGMQRTGPTAVSQVVEQVFNAVFSVWLAYVFFDAARIELAAAGGTAGTGIGALAGLFIVISMYAMAAPKVKKRVKNDGNRKSYEPRRKLLTALARTALPIIIGSSIFAIANFIDMTMIEGRLSAAGFSYEEAKIMYGQFTGKYVLLITLPVSLSMALATAVIPNLAVSRVISDTEAIRQKINMALRLSMFISVPAAVGLGVLGDPILRMLFPGHPDGGRLLQFGVISIIFLALVQIITGILQGVGRVDAPVIAAFFGMLIKIPLNYFLIAIPGINVIGAVISTCVCYMLAGGINIWFMFKYTGVKPDVVGAFIKPLFAAALMGLVCYVMYYLFMEMSGRNAFAAMGAIGVGMGMYLVFMVMVKGFKKEDVERVPRIGKRLAGFL